MNDEFPPRIKPWFGDRKPYRGECMGRMGYWVPIGERGWRMVEAGEFIDGKYRAEDFEDRRP